MSSLPPQLHELREIHRRRSAAWATLFSAVSVAVGLVVGWMSDAFPWGMAGGLVAWVVGSVALLARLSSRERVLWTALVEDSTP